MVGEYPSRTETFVHTQIVGLREKGHEVHVFASLPRSIETTATDADVHYQPALGGGLRRYVGAGRLLAAATGPARRALAGTLNPLRFGRDAVSLRLLSAAAPWVPRRDYDVVHCHFGDIGQRAVMLRQLGVLGGPIVTTFHGYDMSAYVRRWGNRCYRRLLQEGDLFLPVSDRWRQRLITLGGDPARILVHRMGVDCGGIVPARRVIGPGRRRALSVARLIEKKGIEYGIRAFAAVARERRDVRYTIIGGGALRTRLEQLAGNLGVADLVEFAGPLSHDRVLHAFEEADVFLSPSVTASNGDEEGIPIALMEAMAAGVPVIATRHSGIPELVTDGATGLLTEEHDVEGLAAALRLLLDSPEQRTTLGAEGRARILAEYNSARQTDRLIGIYHRVMDER